MGLWRLLAEEILLTPGEGGNGSHAYLLDIEGTTTPLSFVHETLFPYAKERADPFLTSCEGTAEFDELVGALASEHTAERGGDETPPAWRDETTATRRSSALTYVGWLMDRDRKSTALKALQGRIWQVGYDDGSLTAAIYPDVLPALRRWREQKKTIAIFSSGSILAQKLLFAHTGAGDLTPFIDAYFDTTTGPKNDAASYTAIAKTLGHDAADVLFISDIVAELDAAHGAGMRTALCVREGVPPATRHRIVHDFQA